MLAPQFKRLLANALTIFRFFAAAIVLVCLFIPFSGSESLALAAFLLGAISDYWDGRLAREAGGHSAFGRTIDPLADKALTLSALAGLASRDLVGWWLVGCVALRDLVVTVVRSRMNASTEGASARESGKWKTVLQMVFIVACLLVLAFWKEGVRLPWVAWTILYLAIGIALVTFWSGARFIGASRIQKAAAK